MQTKGRVLVTGATGGIGGAIAQALHRQGAKVAISGTRREALALVADLRSGERIFSALMLAYFFLVTTTFWILKPLKKALFIQTRPS